LHKKPLTRSTRRRTVRAPLAFSIVIALVALVAPAGPAVRPSLAAARPATMVAGAADLSAATAESSLVAMINADRAAVGLLPLRLDSRLSAVAHERSASMAGSGQLSHVQLDGQTVVDLVRAAGIAWYSLGETIGWNNYPGLGDSTSVVNRGWMTSPEHVAIIRSTAFNYFGVGLSTTASGDRYWTAIFLRGPDRTAPSATMGASISGSYVTLASRSQVRLVTLSWTGTDLQLAVLTSGLRSFEVQRRVDGGAWVSVWTSTTRRSWSTSVSVGQRVQVRVRARDNAGNVGAWSSPVGLSG
jgi:uncharacterized protein YkwD